MALVSLAFQVMCRNGTPGTGLRAPGNVTSDNPIPFCRPQPTPMRKIGIDARECAHTQSGATCQRKKQN